MTQRMGSSQRQRARKRLLQNADRCYLCGVRVLPETGGREHPRFATIDHVHPLVLGGSNEDANLALACRRCNVSKGDVPPLDLTTPEGRDRALGLHAFIAGMTTCQPLRRIA